MKDVLEDVDAWTARGDSIALATVISVKRSAPRPPGSKMAINEHGEIAGAGLDVLVEEPFPADHPFMTMPNVVLTPHMAAQSQETVSKLVTMAAEGTLAVLRGEKWPYVANPEVYDHPRWKQ